MKLQRYLLYCFIFVTPSIVSAEIYRWVDDSGNTQFGDRPPVAAGAKRIEVEVNSYESVTVEPFEAYNSASAGNNTVVMYSTTWCGVCKRAKRFFQVQKIPFKEYDVEKTRKGKRDFARLNGRGVPIILVGDKRMTGFSVSGFRRLYEARR